MNNLDYKDDYDYWTCKHCGKRYTMELGPGFCGCPESQIAYQKEQLEFEKAFKGSGKTRKGKIVIEYECQDSEPAFEFLFNQMSTSGGLHSPGIVDSSKNPFLSLVQDLDKIKYKITHTRTFI